jgi:pyruvate formate lyase activating enzyme
VEEDINNANVAGNGIIFNIQRFSIHDGPGIRTTVFLKGCPLKCAWCSNPESQEYQPQMMTRDSKCVSCGKCALSCSTGAIDFNSGLSRNIDWTRCDRCFKCVEACGNEALTVMGKYMSVEEVVAEVLKDALFYKNSGGGVTLSGGEPLFQPDFSFLLLKALKVKGLHTAVETSGFAQADTLATILPFTDLLLFDIKQLDDSKHKQYTGAGNGLILSNLRTAAGRAMIWIRIPLISGFNDSPAEIHEISQMAKELGVEKISFLPYHEGGEAKRAQVGKASGSFPGKPPSDKHVTCLVKIAGETGVKATVGS